MPASARIEVHNGGGVWAHLKIRNIGDAALAIHNPGNDRPTAGWELSKEAYQAAVLRSYGFLEVSLRSAEGTPVDPAPVHARAGHLAGLPRQLAPGDELDIAVPVHELYVLQAGKEYDLSLTYGDDAGRYSAATRVWAPGSPDAAITQPGADPTG